MELIATWAMEKEKVVEVWVERRAGKAVALLAFFSSSESCEIQEREGRRGEVCRPTTGKKGRALSARDCCIFFCLLLFCVAFFSSSGAAARCLFRLSRKARRHSTHTLSHPNQKANNMPLLLRRAALAAARTLRARGGGHESKPSFWSAGVRDSEGRLFNESAPAPGTKRKWESWEAPW